VTRNLLFDTILQEAVSMPVHVLGDFRLLLTRALAMTLVAAVVGGLSNPSLLRAQPGQAAPETNDPLPPGLDLPGERSKLLGGEFQKPKITLKEFNDFRPNMSKYVQALRAGDATGTAKSLIEEGIRIQILGMSIPEKQEEIAAMRKKVARDLNNFAGVGDPNERRQRSFRAYVFDLAIKHCMELTLLNQLEIVRADRRIRAPAEPYLNVLPSLRTILLDPEQDTAVKIVAARGVERIVSSEVLSISRNELLTTAEELISELKRTSAESDNTEPVFFGYPLALMDAARATKIDVNRPGRPFIVQTLAEVITNKSADPRVRSHAAFTIVRVPLVPQVRLSVIAFQIASLADELSGEFNRSPQAFYWPECYFKIYAAFQSLDETEKMRNIGLLNQSKLPAFANEQDASGATIDITALIADTYNSVLPVVKFVLDNDRGTNTIPPATSAPLSEWLKGNSPNPNSIAPGEKALSLRN
jgi:hypothetical protein